MIAPIAMHNDLPPMHPMIIFALLFFIPTLSGCTSVGNPVLSQHGDDWPPLTMSKEDLLKELGPPQVHSSSVIGNERRDIYTWTHGHAQTNPALFIPIVGLFVAASGNGMDGESTALSVTFDTTGTIISRAWAKQQIGNQRRSPPNHVMESY